MSGPLYGVRLLVLTQLDNKTGLPMGDNYTIKDPVADPGNKGFGGLISGGSFAGEHGGAIEVVVTKANTSEGTVTTAEFIWRFAGGEWSSKVSVSGNSQTLGTTGVAVTFVPADEGQDFELGDRWTIPVEAVSVRVEVPQQVGFEGQVIEGARQELRGGDRLVATIEEGDSFVGINSTFQDAVLSLDAMRIIGGGTVVGRSYVPPTLEEQAKKPAFRAEIYIGEFAEGSQEVHDVVGFAKITLERCVGKVPSFTAQGQNFLVPSYSIKGRDNAKAGLPSFKIDFVDELPE